jgi:hypothetical protein
LAGWAAAFPKSHKSPEKLILIANFCYIKDSYNVCLYAAMDSFHALIHPAKCVGCRFHISIVKIPIFSNFGEKKLLSEITSFEWANPLFLPFFHCIHGHP